MSGVRWISTHSTSQEINAPLPLKPPLLRAATFVPPLSDRKIDQDVVVQNQKVLFLCNCCSTTLVRSLNYQNCCSGTTGRAKKAEWRQNHCHSGPRVAAVAELRHSGRHSLLGRPMSDPCVFILRPRRCVYLPPASLERPTSSATFVRLFLTCSKPHGDHGIHGVVWTSSVPPLNDQGNLSAFAVPSTATWPILWSHKGDIKVAVPV